MLKLNNLKKVYTSGSGSETVAVNNISAEFPDKGLVFILGKSGSGKSTLLNLLGGIDKPTDGEIIIDGVSSANFKSRDFDSYRNTYIGFVFQEYQLLPEYTVGVNVGLAYELQNRKADRAEIDEILRRVELVDKDGNTLFGRKINELSGGQKQRVAIARALVKQPKIILADEPTGALDSKTGTALYGLLKQLSKERLVIVVTHDEESAKNYGDRIIELADGEIIADTADKAIPQQSQQEEVKFEKKRLSFKRALIMGATGLRFKTFRLVLSVLLAVFSFAVFGFSYVASTTDETTVKLKTLYQHNQHMVWVKGKIISTGPSEDYYIKGKQWAIIEDFVGSEKLMTGAKGKGNIKIRDNVIKPPLHESDESVYESMILQVLTSIKIDSVTGYEDACLRPDDRFEDKSLCRLPQTSTEVGIPDFVADAFIKFGLKDADGNFFKIEKVEDLIGKTLTPTSGDVPYTICGVYSTEIDREYFKQFEETTWEELQENDYYNFTLAYSSAYIPTGRFGFTSQLSNTPISVCYVMHDGYKMTQNDKGIVWVKMTGNLKKDLKFIKSLNFYDDNPKLSTAEKTLFAEITTPQGGFMNPLGFYVEVLQPFVLIIAAVFAVFSALLLLNFLTVSLESRKREIGILRALGASKRDVVTVCFAESGLIALIDFVLTLIAVGVACAVLDGIFCIPMFVLSFLSVLVIFAITAGTAALVAVVPTFKTASKNPIDIINKAI